MVITILATIIFLIVAAVSFIAHRAASLYSGADDRDADARVLYHGSSSRISTLEPRKSNLTRRPVVFGTPSYDDAVIFSATWTDYNFAMFGANGKRYLDEQYPGAFAKLDVIGYIHHLPGADFKILQADDVDDDKSQSADTSAPVDTSVSVDVSQPVDVSAVGLGNEYVCEHEVTPSAVDEVNVLEYLRKSQVVMRTYDEVLAARRDAEGMQIVPLSGVIAHVVFYDDWAHISRIEDICAKLKINFVTTDDISAVDFAVPTVVVGDLVRGVERFTVPCESVWVDSDIDTLVANFSATKTTPEEYRQYLIARRDRMSHMKKITVDELEDYIDRRRTNIYKKKIIFNKHSDLKQQA
jgi:IS1 family transposase